MVQVAPLQLSAAELQAPAALFTALLAVVHLLSGRLRVDGERRRRWLSAASGVSVAYVFVLLLPEVSEAALSVGERQGEALLAEQLVYLMALVGFVVFYGVEVVVVQRRGEPTETATGVYRFHLAVFALYSAVIGFLLFHQEVETVTSLALYAVAMGLHLVATDAGLRRHHGAAFDRWGRWLLAGGTLVGGAMGALAAESGLALSMTFGFLAGAIVLNVVKEELPSLDQSRFVAFVSAALAYTVVLLLT